MADPGVPMEVARAIAGSVEERLADDGDGTWRVDVREGRLPLNERGEVPLFAEADKLRETSDWDYVVYLTDLPRIHDRDIELCEVSGCQQAALVSIPSSGMFRLTKRIGRLVTALVRSASANTYEYPSDEGLKEVLGRRKFARHANPERDDTVGVYLPGRRNQVALLLGMIRSNRPGRLLTTLTNSFAIAFATGAFGIFYGSIWELSDALPRWRLLLISISAVLLLGVWLIVRNGLWARNRNPYLGRARLDNTATVVTIAVSVLLFHASLIAVLFVLGIVVIESEYLAAQLEEPVRLLHYWQLSWLSASLGTLAGALGTNFNSEDSIREATYSRRVYERRKLSGSFEHD